MIRRMLPILMAAAISAVLAPGCGCNAPKTTATKPDTMSKTGAVCDTTLDTTAAAASVAQPDTERPAPAKKTEPVRAKPRPVEEVAGKPKELPRMWDFGSTKCIPCKTMKEILDPMIADYKGKVDIRIINVYEEKELAAQFRISVIPTQAFMDSNGNELFRHIGVFPRDSIEARFREFGMPVVAASSTGDK